MQKLTYRSDQSRGGAAGAESGIARLLLAFIVIAAVVAALEIASSRRPDFPSIIVQMEQKP